jgi:hypothetical protein
MAWSTAQERDDAIRNAHVEGHSTKWMRRELKVSSTTITKALNAVGIFNPGHAYKRLDWSADKIGLLSRLWGEGESTRDIAKALGCSRRGAERKAKSIGLPPKVPAKSGPTGTGQPRSRAGQRIAHITVLHDEPPSLELALMDLNPFHCRWITTGEGAGAKFCGQVAIKEYGYCPAHHSIAYVPADSRPRNQRHDYHLFRRAA